ncbi:hypothetical protein BH09ACT4_BH09ACT4_04240 [soil metagenome]
MKKPMTPVQEDAYYSDPANLVPQGPARRRNRAPLSAPVPVRFPESLLEQLREQAEADDRSISSWIRIAVEHELERTPKRTA